MNKKLIVVSGPSGAGKSAVVKSVLEFFRINPLPPHQFARVVTSTTRKIRECEGEKNGEHYFFYDEFDFAEKIHLRHFIEHVKYQGNHYGTEYASLERVLREKKIPILTIELEGAAAIKAYSLRSLRIFLKPGSFEDLERRMEGRNDAKGRLEKSKQEIADWQNHCNCLVTNVEGRFEETVVSVADCIKKYLADAR